MRKDIELKEYFYFNREKNIKMFGSYDLLHFIYPIPWLTIFFYTFIVFLLVFLITLLYLKSKYGFWVSQPVFHSYDFSYYLYPPGIIRMDLPEKNKYTNFKDITTTVYNELSSLQKLEMIHFLRKGENSFLPESTNVFPYFEGLTHESLFIEQGKKTKNTKNKENPCFFSFYWEKSLLTDLKKGTIIENKKIIGSITSRPIKIRILHLCTFKSPSRRDGQFTSDKGNSYHALECEGVKRNDQNASFLAYYMDYLCVDESHRKKGIASQMIQTHEYNQRHLNKNIQVSLFKREGELTNGIVPLCSYTTYGFSVLTWRKPVSLPPNYQIIEFSKQNLHLLRDFLKENEDHFDILLEPSFSNLLELIQTKNIYVCAVLENDVVLCVYFYCDSCVFIEKDMRILTCYATVKSDACSKEIFIQGFKNSFWNTADKNNFGFCVVENISHNHWIIANLLKKSTPVLKKPTAYFFYNFAYPTFSAEKVFL